MLPVSHVPGSGSVLLQPDPTYPPQACTASPLCTWFGPKCQDWALHCLSWPLCTWIGSVLPPQPCISDLVCLAILSSLWGSPRVWKFLDPCGALWAKLHGFVGGKGGGLSTPALDNAIFIYSHSKVSTACYCQQGSGQIRGWQLMAHRPDSAHGVTLFSHLNFGISIIGNSMQWPEMGEAVIVAQQGEQWLWLQHG